MVQLTVQQALDRAVQLHQQGQGQEAEHLYRQILIQQPNHADALHLLGVVAAQAGRPEEAIDLIQRAIGLKSDWPQAFVNLGKAFYAAGRSQEAVAAHRQAIALNPKDLQTHEHLANVLHISKRFDEASLAWQQLIQLQPKHFSAHHSLGVALTELQRPLEAISAYRAALRINPNSAATLNNLGALLQTTGEPQQAIAAWRRSIDLAPANAETYNNLANALRQRGDFDQAIATYQQAITLAPNHPEIYRNLGGALTEMGQYIAAIDACRRSIQLNPSPRESNAYPNLLFALLHDPACDGRQFLAESKAWARLQPCFPLGNFSTRNRNPDRRLRIGYLSSYFAAGAEAHFLIPLLAHHDPAAVEVYCFSRTNPPDATTDRLRSHSGHWFDIHTFDIKDAVERVHSYELDILVTISKPADACMTMLASRIAPIQVNWLAFGPFTTGLETVDYRISDPFIDPIDSEQPYSETTLRLPETAWCYDSLLQPLGFDSEESPSNRPFTFGSMNRFGKVNPAVIDIWAEILSSLPESRLRIVAIAGNAEQMLLERFARLGINPSRITLIENSSRLNYLKQYHHIDVMLDTFPYGGHTTVFDALWMGVPVITCDGGNALGRAGVSALRNLQLNALVAKDPRQYVQIALELASDATRLRQLQSSLRQQMKHSPLMNAPRFAGFMEAAYRQMWTRWCSNNASAALH